MLTTVLRARITELHWLVDELEHELGALATTPHPRVHRFLMRSLTTRIARVAVQVQGHLAEQPPGASLPSPVARLLEQSV